MKEKYITPEMDIVNIDTIEIITTSETVLPVDPLSNF